MRVWEQFREVGDDMALQSSLEEWGSARQTGRGQGNPPILASEALADSLLLRAGIMPQPLCQPGQELYSNC